MHTFYFLTPCIFFPMVTLKKIWVWKPDNICPFAQNTRNLKCESRVYTQQKLGKGNLRTAGEFSVGWSDT